MKSRGINYRDSYHTIQHGLVTARAQHVCFEGHEKAFRIHEVSVGLRVEPPPSRVVLIYQMIDVSTLRRLVYIEPPVECRNPFAAIGQKSVERIYLEIKPGRHLRSAILS